MTSRQLFWLLPVSAVVLVGVTLWDRTQGRVGSGRPEVQVAAAHQPVGPDLQFELYDAHNRTVRLSRYLGRHRVDLVFLASDGNVNDDPIFKAVGRPSSDRIILVVSQNLPQVIRRQLGQQQDSTSVVLSDAGGRMGQVPGAAARAWGAMSDEGRVARTSWYVIDRAGRVDWSAGRPVARKSGGKRVVRKATEKTDR
tara:strand:+ start:5921 stop:6511 length:591 start_codon:yes stop_codon:yes gene_type:complete